MGRREEEREGERRKEIYPSLLEESIGKHITILM